MPAVPRRAAGTSRRRPAGPTLRHERTYAEAGHRILAGCDEVGRGALAGPVTVGMVAVDIAAVKPLKGVKDSKLLAPADRVALVPKIQAWAAASGVGHASAAEIDRLGLTGALRLAGTRAWAQVCADLTPDVVLLDGNYNWLSPAQASLFDDLDAAVAGDGPAEAGVGRGTITHPIPAEPALPCEAPVHTRIKADLSCLSVAAASVLAKVARDSLMLEYAREYPQFGWDENKGYATDAHRAALQADGPSPLHRLSWRLGGTPRPAAAAEPDDEYGVDELQPGGMIEL